jgi:hypothetical protein
MAVNWMARNNASMLPGICFQSIKKLQAILYDHGQHHGPGPVGPVNQRGFDIGGLDMSGIGF